MSSSDNEHHAGDGPHREDREARVLALRDAAHVEEPAERDDERGQHEEEDHPVADLEAHVGERRDAHDRAADRLRGDLAARRPQVEGELEPAPRQGHQRRGREKVAPPDSRGAFDFAGCGAHAVRPDRRVGDRAESAARSPI